MRAPLQLKRAWVHSQEACVGLLLAPVVFPLLSRWPQLRSAGHLCSSRQGHPWEMHYHQRSLDVPSSQSMCAHDKLLFGSEVNFFSFSICPSDLQFEDCTQIFEAGTPKPTGSQRAQDPCWQSKPSTLGTLRTHPVTLDLIYKGTTDGLLAQDLQSIMQGSRRSHCSYTQSLGGFCKSVPFSYSTQFPASLLAHNYLLCWVCFVFSRQNRKQFCLSFLALNTGEVCVSMAACEGNEVHLIILKPNPSFPQSKPTKNAISVQQ